MWTVSKVCTKCHRLFHVPEKSMRQLCGRCVKTSRLASAIRGESIERHAYLLRTYNITSANYDEMLKLQGGVCAICHKPPKRGTRLHVDHDHLAHSVRGLLCTGCNTRLGWYEAHKAAVDLYLRKTR
jgi:hypothetical protein